MTAPAELAKTYFDSGFYLSQSEGAVPSDPFEHYLSLGAAAELSPCKYFDQAWYGWQNPDWQRNHENSFFHYLEVGRLEGRDPSPLVDFVRVNETLGNGLPYEVLSDTVLRGRTPMGCGVYASFDDLELHQKQFYGAINPTLIRAANALERHKNLVILQAGESGLHHEWFDANANRNWDLCVNLYSASDKPLDGAEYVIAQTGTKATAMAMFASTFYHIVQGYDHILFLDDDVSVDMASLNRMFETCAKYNLDAAQMSLSKRSNCVWPLFFSQGSGDVRYTNGVEIMMPVLSRRCFAACRDLFGRSVSGFGLDLAIGQRASKLGSRNIAVLDNCVAEHLRPIDSSGGGLYSYLRSVGINPKAELWQMKRAQNFSKTFQEV